MSTPPSVRLLSTAALFLLALVAVACGTTEEPTASGPSVVATTSVLGDLVEQVVGDGAAVTVLVPAGVDPHGYAPSARQGEQVREADLVVAVGLGLEASLQDLLEIATTAGVPLLEIGPLVDPLPAGEDHIDEHAGEHADEHGDEHGDEHSDEHAGEHPEGEHADEHGHGDLDPHVWLDPVRMADAVRAIGAALEDLVPGAQDDAERVASELLALDREVAATLEAVPTACRSLVTDHESFGYLAARYDFEVIGAVLPGTSSGAAPSARDVAELVELVREAGVRAIFVGEASPSRLVQTLVSGVGDGLEVVELYSDALGPAGSAGATYTGMLRTNAERIAAALADC